MDARAVRSGLCGTRGGCWSVPVSLLRLFPVGGTPLGLAAHQRVTDKVGVRAFASAGGALYSAAF